MSHYRHTFPSLILVVLFLAACQLATPVAPEPPEEPTAETNTLASNLDPNTPVPIDPGRIATLTHDLGGNPQDYLVDLRCWIASDVEGSIHNRGVGGDDTSAGMKGVTWYLDNSGGDATIRI